MSRKLFCDKKNGWKLFEKKTKDIEKISDEYKEFLDNSKTERTSVKTLEAFLKDAGYKSMDSIKTYKTGTKFYHINRGKAMVAGILGKNDLTENGVRYLVSHIDVPHLHLKPDPLFEDSSKLALMRTQYYGGIKKHHWVNIPLALYGTVYLKDGKEVEIKFGDDGKTALLIPDLAIHIDKDVVGRKYSEIVKGEELKVIVGSKPVLKKKEEKDAIKENILTILNKEYGIEERDILTGEFQVVPTHKAMDVGFDKSLIGGFGHDDRVCAYASVRGLLDAKKTDDTILSYWFDREEIGSTGNTGAESTYFEYLIAMLIEIQNKGKYNDLMLKRTLEKSFGISADVSPALDPNFKMAYDVQNTALLGYGPLFHKYSGSRGKMFSNEVSPKFLSRMTAIFDDNKIPWQMQTMGKVDAGGGGTIANCLCNLNTEVVDSGVPILGLHSPYELVSKVDLYATCKAYQAFLEEKI